MSSSLLLVLIVVVWLFVLAPLVVNTRQPIRRTSEALGRTRLLHQGGESVATRRRRPTLTERDVRKPGEEVDESLETVDAELDDLRDDAVIGDARGRDDLDDDILIDDLDDADGESRRGRRGRRGRAADSRDGAVVEEVPAVVEGDVVYELEAGASDAAADADGEDGAGTDSDLDAEVVVEADAPTDDAPEEGAVAEQDTDAALDDADVSDEEPLTRATAGKAIADSPAEDARAYLTPEDFLVVDGETSAEEPATADAADADADGADGTVAAGAGADADAAGEADDERVLLDDADADDATDSDADFDSDSADLSTGALDSGEDFDDFDDTLTDDDLAFAERRRGRGGFDPVSDARYAETRFARRRRSVGVLAAFIVLGVILGAFVGGWTWWLPLAGAGLMVLYLVYLRRTVIAENELRARRIRRMKMARMGVRNSEDEELGIPERLRRPGAVVVELDDEDPDFADLPYATYEFPEEDIRRAAGQ